LRQAHPCADAALLELHERLSRHLFAQAARTDAHIRLDGSELVALRDLVRLLEPLPEPWPRLIDININHWVSWAALDHRLLQWRWHLDVLEPLQELQDLLAEQPSLLISGNGQTVPLQQELTAAGFAADVVVHLREPSLLDPLPLFAPRRQPLPNTEIYSEHLLEQSRRLILGRTGLTVVLLDDNGMRQRLASELAGEFGSRVIHEATTPDSNGVICCRWSWWLQHQDQLPSPEQLIVGLLPIASLESPLTAARVEALKRQGRDWFRELLLPEALALLPPAIAPLRRAGGRLAILDGRVHGRSWGEQVLTALQPWTPLQRLLPS
jgi:ATP-dependent DNA helicase DinG